MNPGVGAGPGVSETAPSKYEVRMATWEEFVAESEDIVRRVVAQIGPRTLLIAVSDMIQGYASYEFYKESEYDELLQELRKTGNWDWVRRLEEFKSWLRCAEEPLGYYVFWGEDRAVIDIVMVVAFLDEKTANLVVYSVRESDQDDDYVEVGWDA
jgi:hypothetical protein